MPSLFAYPKALSLATIAFLSSTATAVTENADLCGISSAWATTDGQYISEYHVNRAFSHLLTLSQVNNNAWGADGSGAQCTEVWKSEFSNPNAQFNSRIGFEWRYKF